MNPSFHLAPSPHDRLDPAGRALRWWVSQLAGLIRDARRSEIAIENLDDQPDRPLPEKITLTAPSSEIFITSLRLPPASPLAHRQALKLKLPELAPLDLASLHIAAQASDRASDGMTTYRLAMIRKDAARRAEDLAWKRGARNIVIAARNYPDLGITPPRTGARRRSHMALDVALTIALTVSLATMMVSAHSAVLRDAEALAVTESELRAVSLDRERAGAAAALSGAVITGGVLERRPGRLIADLAAITDATPDDTWWTGMQWDGRQINLTGVSGEAAPAAQALSARLPEWNVALSGAVRPTADGGGQQFQLLLTRKATP